MKLNKKDINEMMSDVVCGLSDIIGDPNKHYCFVYVSLVGSDFGATNAGVTYHRLSVTPDAVYDGDLVGDIIYNIDQAINSYNASAEIIHKEDDEFYTDCIVDGRSFTLDICIQWDSKVSIDTSGTVDNEIEI